MPLNPATLPKLSLTRAQIVDGVSALVKTARKDKAHKLLKAILETGDPDVILVACQTYRIFESKETSKT